MTTGKETKVYVATYQYTQDEDSQPEIICVFRNKEDAEKYERTNTFVFITETILK